MSLYRTIYAPSGEAFEVSPDRADDLVLNMGWSNTAPKPSRARRSKVEMRADEPQITEPEQEEPEAEASYDGE